MKPSFFLVLAALGAVACGSATDPVGGDQTVASSVSSSAAGGSGTGGAGGAGGAECVPKTCDETPACSPTSEVLVDLGCGVMQHCEEFCGDATGKYRVCQTDDHSCECYKDTADADAAICGAGKSPHFCGADVALGKVSNCSDTRMQRADPTGNTAMASVWCCDY